MLATVTYRQFINAVEKDKANISLDMAIKIARA